MEEKNMKEIPENILEMIAGGTPEDAQAYLQTMVEKYGITDFAELWAEMDLYEQQYYITIYDWKH